MNVELIKRTFDLFSLEVQAEVSDCKSFDLESITISEKSSKTMDSLKALAGSIKYVLMHTDLNQTKQNHDNFSSSSSRDACAVPNTETSSENICSGQGDGTGRKSSLLSSASDYARSINIEQHSNLNRAGSPSNDKTVSFVDEPVRVKSK